MTESMAAGTPVIAINLGSVPEVIVHGKTGLFCNSISECINAVNKVAELNRHACRKHVRELF